MKFKEGDRVIFVRNIRGYSLGRGNPIQGSSWACEGTVTHAGTILTVRWDNGHLNSYVPECLELITPSNNPNILFAARKRNEIL
jgi:hypothetical protein